MKESFDEFQLFFSDLNEEAQKQILEFYNITDPCEARLDVSSLTILEKTDEGDRPFTPEENKKFVQDVAENVCRQK